MPGTQGKVAGWGLTKLNEEPSEILKSINIPIVPLDQCRNEATKDYKPFITDDKLCAGYKDGSGVCKGKLKKYLLKISIYEIYLGDSGAGLVYSEDPESQSFYIWGIVSNGPQKKSGAGGCDLKFYSLYTNVQLYTNFIKEAYKRFPSN